MDNIREFIIISQEQRLKDFKREVELNEIKIPQRGTRKSAGYDFFLINDLKLEPGEDIKIPTGIKVKLGDSDFLAIVPRSSLGFKFYTTLANTIGIIDADFCNNKKNEGHIWVKFKNGSDKTLELKAGDAFCQGIIITYRTVFNDKPASEVRTGGIGSTNK